MSPWITFVVLGTPAPQGSKSRMPNGAILEGKSAGERARHRDWRSAVAAAAADAAAVAAADGHTVPLDGPLALEVRFRFAMPASRSKALREAGLGWKPTAPDLDKLIRSTGDALKVGGLIVDDARIVEIRARKTEVAGWTGADVRVRRLGVPTWQE